MIPLSTIELIVISIIVLAIAGWLLDSDYHD